VVPVSWMTVFLDFPARLFGPGAAFWQALTATTVSPPRGRAGEFATLIPSRGDACLRVQATGSAAAGCHLDLHTADVTGGARAARELGARLVRAEDGLATLRSPGGLGFCLVRDEGAGRRPEPEAWPGGHRSLVDQLSIDVPPEDYAGECAFWSALTGWPRVRSSRPEFEFLDRPPGLPFRLLLQRTDDADGPGGGACSAHPDLACDDVAAERSRHEALGAVVVRVMPNWTTLRDPAGLAYCITRRDPGTGKLPDHD
jgi:hypothetical protein